MIDLPPNSFFGLPDDAILSAGHILPYRVWTIKHYTTVDPASDLWVGDKHTLLSSKCNRRGDGLLFESSLNFIVCFIVLQRR